MDALELEILTVPHVNHLQNRFKGLLTNAWRSAQITQLISSCLMPLPAHNATLIVQLALMEVINQIVTHAWMEKSKMQLVSQRTQNIAEIHVLLRLTKTMEFVKVGSPLF